MPTKPTREGGTKKKGNKKTNQNQNKGTRAGRPKKQKAKQPTTPKHQPNQPAGRGGGPEQAATCNMCQRLIRLPATAQIRKTHQKQDTCNASFHLNAAIHECKSLTRRDVHDKICLFIPREHTKNGTLQCSCMGT